MPPLVYPKAQMHFNTVRLSLRHPRPTLAFLGYRQKLCGRTIFKAQGLALNGFVWDLGPSPPPPHPGVPWPMGLGTPQSEKAPGPKLPPFFSAREALCFENCAATELLTVP